MNNKKLLYVLVPVVICVVVLGILLFPKGNPAPADGNENEVVAVTENDVTELPEETEESDTLVLDAPWYLQRSDRVQGADHYVTGCCG